MGPMICNEAVAAGFMKINLYSNWANGAKGLLWWCANEQSHLEASPMEKMLLTDEKAFEQEYFEVYKLAAGKALEGRYAVSANRYVGVTEHIGDDGVYVVLVNYSLAEQSSALTVKKGWSREAVLYGNPEMLEPGGMAILRIKENKR